MVTQKGSIAHMNAIFPVVSKAVNAVRESDFRAEKLYQISLSLARTMLGKGLISADEFTAIDTMLLEKYRPTLGSLLSGIS